MFTTPDEKEFFLSEIDSTKKVLEYGSGDSTFIISSLCKEIISVEHQSEWYHNLIEKKPSNCTLLYFPPELPYKEGVHDGTFDQFRKYVMSPIEHAPFDIVFIDGRARVSCASICHQLTHKNGIIFIHDFERVEYRECLNFLDMIGMVDKMAKFKLKV